MYLVRHGETVWNRIGRMQGQLNSPLTPLGLAQAQAVGKSLRETLRLDGVINPVITSSPLGRAWQTAVIIAGEIGINPNQVNLAEPLREVTWGQWDGLTRAEIIARWPEQWAAREQGKWHQAPPNGESYAQVAKRAAIWLAGQNDSDDLIIVAHGLLNRVLRGLYLKLSHEEIFQLEEPQNAYYRLSGGGEARLDTTS